VRVEAIREHAADPAPQLVELSRSAAGRWYCP
jgi:hypothetical protein